MMTTFLLPLVCVLIMVIYVLVKALKKAERNAYWIIKELGRKNAFDSEQEGQLRQFLKLIRLVSRPHTGVEHQLFVVSVLTERYSQRSDDVVDSGILSDLLLLQCFLLDVLELTDTPVNNSYTYNIQQQVRDKLRLRSFSSWHEREHEVEK